MNTNDFSKNDFTIVFDKVKEYNEVNSLSDGDFLKPEEIITNEEIRNFSQLCKELNNNATEPVIYKTFC